MYLRLCCLYEGIKVWGWGTGMSPQTGTVRELLEGFLSCRNISQQHKLLHHGICLSEIKEMKPFNHKFYWHKLEFFKGIYDRTKNLRVTFKFHNPLQLIYMYNNKNYLLKQKFSYRCPLSHCLIIPLLC